MAVVKTGLKYPGISPAITIRSRSLAWMRPANSRATSRGWGPEFLDGLHVGQVGGILGHRGDMQTVVLL